MLGLQSIAAEEMVEDAYNMLCKNRAKLGYSIFGFGPTITQEKGLGLGLCCGMA